MILTIIPVLICHKGRATLIADCYTIMVIRYMIQGSRLIKVILPAEAAHAHSYIFCGRFRKPSHAL